MVTKNIGAADGDDSDPPIIVTGGGGDGAGKVASRKNFVTIDYHPDGSSARKKIKAKNNAAPNVVGVRVEFVTKPLPTTQPPITLSGADQYNVHVTFLTDPPPPPRPGRKKKKTPKKKAPAKRSYKGKTK